MTYRGRVEKGVIVLENSPELPEGAPVKVEVGALEPQAVEQPVADAPRISALLKYAGCIDDLPPDASERYEEYLYGRNEP